MNIIQKAIMGAKMRTTLYCCMLLAISFSAVGQEEKYVSNNGNILSDITWENQYLKRNLTSMDNVDLNLLTLRQMGLQNQATINQISESSDPNLMFLMQQGEQNFVDIQQTGGNNALKLVQKGKMNSFSADYEGEYLINSISQEGELNVIEQTLQGKDMNFSIIQKGVGHELIQTENGFGVGYKVTQTGKDMKISIDQGHVMVK